MNQYVYFFGDGGAEGDGGMKDLLEAQTISAALGAADQLDEG